MTAEKRKRKDGPEGTSAPGSRGAPGGQLDVGWGVAAAVFFGLALLYFLPALAPGRGIYGTDYLAGAYPFFEFMASRFRALELPGWVPYVYGGVPLFASPGSGFYPVWLLLSLVIPVAAIFPLLFVIQFGVAGFGMYLLLRELDARAWVAGVTGLAFQFTGVVMSYVFAGHDGRIIVATLTPLFLFFLHRLVRTGRFPAFVGAAGTLGFALLTFQIQSSYYLLLAGLAWGIFALVALRVRGRALWSRLALGFGAVAVAFLLASVNFLPFLDYVDASPRGGEEGRGYEYSTSWDMAPLELTGLAVPEYVGVSVHDPVTGEAQFPTYRGHNALKYHTEYVGAVVLLLLALGAWYSRRDRYWWFFLGVAAIGLTIAFGGHTPLYRLYYEFLPGTRRFRAPSIAFFLVAFALVAMAGLTLERLARLRDPDPGSGRGSGRGSDPGSDPGSGPGSGDGSGPTSLAPASWIALGSGGLALLLLLAGGAAEGPDGIGLGVARFALFLAGAAALFWAWLAGRLGARAFALLLSVLLVADLWIIDQRFFHTVEPPSVWFQADDVVRAVRSQPETGRAWVLPVGQRYHGTGNYLMLHDIDLAGGEHPNPLQRWYEYVGEGEGHYVDWHNFLGGNTNFLNAANVRWIVSMVQLEGVPQLPELRRIHGGPSALVYENPAALPRAYLVGEVRMAAEPDGAIDVLADPAFDPRTTAVLYEPLDAPLPGGAVRGSARLVEESPDELRLRVVSDGPALLVVADNYYPGWEATVGGEPAPVRRANHTFRAVPVPAGEHDVVLRFRPAGLRVGFALYAAGLLFLFGYGSFMALRQWQAGRPRPSA